MLSQNSIDKLKKKKEKLKEEGEEKLVRLQKVISNAGIASRRQAENLIVEGNVKVNGRIVKKLGTKVDPTKDTISVKGKELKTSPQKIAILFYKPKGCISSIKDPEGRPTLIDFLKKIKIRIFPIGRLDYNSEGAIILTNDGELTYKLAHPKYKVPKEYMVKIKGNPEDEIIKKLYRGVKLDDGIAKPDMIKKIKEVDKNSWLLIKLTEGRKHLIKRMMQALGYPVLKIKRIKFAGIALGSLRPGEYRYLTDSEIMKIKRTLEK